MISKTFLNSQTSTKSTTTDRSFQWDIWCVLLFTQLSMILQETIQYRGYLHKGECPTPLPPQTLLVACSGLSTSFCSCQGCWTKTFPEKSHEVLFGSVGWSRWRIQEQGSEEAGGGTRLFPPGVVSGWIRLKCIVKLLHQGNVHTQ